MGKPMVVVDDDQRLIVSAWGLLDVELRNTSFRDLRVSDIWLQIWTGHFPYRLVLEANPAAIDTDDARRDLPRRVEWLLPSAGEAVTHTVRFAKSYGRSSPTAPANARQFEAMVVAELGRPDRQIRVRLQKDIWGAK